MSLGCVFQLEPQDNAQRGGRGRSEPANGSGCELMRYSVLIPAAGLAAAIAIATAAPAQFTPHSPGSPRQTVRAATDVTDVRLETDVARILPGSTFHLLVVFKAREKWHLYWKNPGAGAAAPEVSVKAPLGFEVGEICWPRPKIISSAVGDMYCHEGEFALFIPVTAPDSLRDGAVMFSAEIAWAVCDDDVCLIGNVSRQTTIETFGPVIPGGETRSRLSPLAVKHAARLPIQVKTADDAMATFENGKLTITGPAHGHGEAAFFPNGAAGVTYSNANITFADNRFTAVIDVQLNPRNFGRRQPAIGGLLALGTKLDDPGYEAEVPLPSLSSSPGPVNTIEPSPTP